MSSETKFTKGDWKINHTGPHWNNPELANIEITCSDIGECICDTVYRIEDAHLIKTAPKLYAEIESEINELKERLADVDKKSGDYNHLTGRINFKESLLAEARGE